MPCILVHQISLIARSHRMHIYIYEADRPPPRNDNFTFLLTCSGQEWQFYIDTEI